MNAAFFAFADADERVGCAAAAADDANDLAGFDIEFFGFRGTDGDCAIFGCFRDVLCIENDDCEQCTQSLMVDSIH